jgi:hypothetical protein
MFSMNSSTLEAATTNGGVSPSSLHNLAYAQLWSGKLAVAQATAEQGAEEYPESSGFHRIMAVIAYLRGDHQATLSHADSVSTRGPRDFHMAQAAGVASAVVGVQGLLAESDRRFTKSARYDLEQGLTREYLLGAVWRATLNAQVRNTPAAGVERLEQAVRRFPLESLDALDRPYLGMAHFYASIGHPGRADRLPKGV